jgi:hypothetical protein
MAGQAEEVVFDKYLAGLEDIAELDVPELTPDSLLDWVDKFALSSLVWGICNADRNRLGPGADGFARIEKNDQHVVGATLQNASETGHLTGSSPRYGFRVPLRPNPYHELPKTFRPRSDDLRDAKPPNGWKLTAGGERKFYGEYRNMGQIIGAPGEGDPKIVAFAMQQFASDLARITVDCFKWRKTITPYPFAAAS